jgi:hypothetical protein
LVAVAVLITGHWQIGVAPAGIYRLDRWTGSVVACKAPEANGSVPCERE